MLVIQPLYSMGPWLISTLIASPAIPRNPIFRRQNVRKCGETCGFNIGACTGDCGCYITSVSTGTGICGLTTPDEDDE